MKYAKWISALILLFIPMLAAAQMGSGERATTQVPFRFMVGNVTIPAGDCVVQILDANGPLLMVGNRDAKRWIYALGIRSQSKKAHTSALVFKRYGNSYFLAELKIEDSGTVYAFRPSKAEEELLAQNIPADEEILLASR